MALEFPYAKFSTMYSFQISGIIFLGKNKTAHGKNILFNHLIVEDLFWNSSFRDRILKPRKFKSYGQGQ